MKIKPMMNGEIINLVRCNVMLGQNDQCTNEAVSTFKCVIDVVSKGMQEHNVHVCEKHKRHFEERNL